MKVLFIGELNPDLVLQGYGSFPRLGQEVLVEDCQLTLGSATAICAVGMSRLGNDVSFFGKVGQDPYGDFCVDFLKAEGIDVRRLLRDRCAKTGLTASITGPTDRALVTYLGAIVSLSERDIDDSLFEGFQHLHMASYYLQLGLRPGVRSILERATNHGLTTSLDPGCDPSGQWGPEIRSTLEHVDVFLPNEVELAGITGEADMAKAMRLLENGRTLTVTKLGTAGAMAVEHNVLVHVPALLVEPVDTTGAGDSFNAGFLHCWLRKAPLAEALSFAAACGALSTKGFGGTGAQPNAAEAALFLAERTAQPSA